MHDRLARPLRLRPGGLEGIDFAARNCRFHRRTAAAFAAHPAQLAAPRDARLHAFPGGCVPYPHPGRGNADKAERQEHAAPEAGIDRETLAHAPDSRFARLRNFPPARPVGKGDRRQRRLRQAIRDQWVAHDCGICL
jgi:hypothetical protein